MAPEGHEDLSPATQRYLLAAAVALRRDAAITTGGVARILKLRPPTSHEKLRHLQEAGYLIADGERRGRWWLTVDGQREVAALRRRRSVLERYLRKELGMDAQEAAEEVERLSPSVSSSVEARMHDAVWPARPPCRELGHPPGASTPAANA